MLIFYLKYLLMCSTKYAVFQVKNSKVFEQKGNLLNFKANIDPRAVLIQVKPSQAEPS